MKIAIGCDHGGFTLKSAVMKHLETEGYDLQDFGCYDENSVDYPKIAAETAHYVADGKADFGIIICSTGIGVSICANKVNGIRAALCTDTHLAEMTRRHNNANVLCMGGHIVTKEAALRITDVFLRTEFEGGRHQRRVDQITDIENKKL